MKRIKLFALAVSAFMLWSGCSTNPVTGKKQLTLMSESQEIALGQEADPQIISQYGLYEDEKLQKFINEKGKAMGAISHRPNLTYQFRIVDSDILNAFAVPGGYVYFTRGIMAHFNDEAQFAGVLGHEIGHIAARHSVIQQRNALLGNLGLIAGIIIKPELADFAQTASQGMQLLMLKFSRDDESQSDKLGVEYSSKIGYDARQMASFFTTLDRQSAQGSGNTLPEFLSTHPNPSGRHDKVMTLAVDWQTKNPSNYKINRNEYLRLIDGIVYGPDPRQGFMENSTFYHPTLTFQWNLPAGWSVQNLPSVVQAAPSSGDALIQMTLASGTSTTEAAQTFVTNNKLNVVDSRETTINGFKTTIVIADVPASQNNQQALRVMAYFVQKGNNIYQLLGIAVANAYNNYQNLFAQSFNSFKTLTDQSKINRQPERVRIKTVASTASLEQVLRSFNMPQNRLEELAILNGMNLKDQVEKGTLIKIVQ